MDFHRPPLRAACARGATATRLPVAFALAVGLAAASCSSADQPTAVGETGSDLPAELVAAEGDDANPTPTAGGDAGVRGDDVTADGFAPIENVETIPADEVEPETVDLGSDAPATIIEEVSEELADAGDGDELLDAIDPVDQAEEPPAEPDGRSRNGFGELLELDEEASLACANVEIAIGQLDEGSNGVAADHVRFGAERAGASGIADIRSWVEPLRAAAEVESGDPAALIGFLTVCTEGGYEL